MIRQRGFTLIELMIVMVIMVIIMALGVIQLGNIQAQSRDSERAQDTAAIARGLEQRYLVGNPVATSDSINKGTYPSVIEILHAQGQDVGTSSPAGIFSPEQADSPYLTQLLPGTTDDSFLTPSGRGFAPICGLSGCGFMAGDSSHISAALANAGYIYEPVKPDGTVCDDGNCSHFNIYWVSETDKTVVDGIAGLKIVKSKHQ